MEAIKEDSEFSVDDDHETVVSSDNEAAIRGVVFGKSVRSSFASLHLACPIQDSGDYNDDENMDHVLVRLQFMKDNKELRSHCRRFCKLGDFMTIRGGTWKSIADTKVDTQWQAPRMVVDLHSLKDATRILRLTTPRCWNMKRCQNWQQEYLDVNPLQGKITGLNSALSSSDTILSTPQLGGRNCHAGGLGKRRQGEYVTNFLVNMTMQQIFHRKHPITHAFPDPSEWATLDGSMTKLKFPHLLVLRQQAIDALNGGTGVVDAAGGSGHVSMALGLAGVQSTIVDPRETVGKLPGRDRKIWNRAMHKRRMHSLQPNLELVDDSSTMYCQPVQYSSYRAWFGKPVEFRHDEQASLPVCEGDHYLLSNCTAIVALHPDEATDAIVDVAIQRQVPLVIVPCCVFFRLFPHRRRPGIDKPVSTHEDLLHFLSGKDPTIRRTTLPFEGANTILWSVF